MFDEDMDSEIESAENSSDESLELSEDAEQLEIDGELEDSELASFDSEEVEDLEHIDDTQALSIIESVLFATDKPQGLGAFRQVFKGTVINKVKIKKLLEEIKIDYAGGSRGITLEETSGGYQLRTKADNMAFIKRMIKGRSFKLSGPALEVLSIVAYKQPCIKSQVDEIRGVESGHLLRGLMDRGMVNFAGKSDLPGKPMFYQTSRKFLEIFGLRNLNELPTLSEIDELLPEGIDEEALENETLDQISSSLSKEALETYSESEEELGKITDQLSTITTSSDFFEQEKIRIRKEKDDNRAQDIEDALTVGEDVEARDVRWLEKYKAKLAEAAAVTAQAAEGEVAEAEVAEPEQTTSSDEIDFALKDHDFVEDEQPANTEDVDASVEVEQPLEASSNAAEDEPLDVKVEEIEESKIGDVNISALKNDIDALS